MAMSITIAINLEENATYTAHEAAVIRALAGDVERTQTVQINNPAVEATQTAPSAEVAAEEAPAEKPKRTRRTTKAAPAPEAEESTTPAVLDTTLDDDPIAEGQKLDEAQTEELDPAEEQLRALENAPTYTLEQAVSIATELIGNGGKAKVKAALDALNVGRVTELKDDPEGLSKFVALIQAD